MLFNTRIAVGAFWVLVVSQLAIGGNPFLSTTPPAEDRGSIYNYAGPGEGGGSFAGRTASQPPPPGTEYSTTPGAPMANFGGRTFASTPKLTTRGNYEDLNAPSDRYFGTIAMASQQWRGAFQVGGSGGQFVAGVNTMTGRHSQSIPIGSIGATGGISFPIELNYIAPLPMGLNMDPRFTTPYNAGYGWGLEFPFIVTDHKGTADPKDDVFYANLGVLGGGGRLVPATTEGEFVLDNNPGVRIVIAGETANSMFIRTWIARLQDGTEIVFGGRTDALRRKFRNNLLVGVTKALAETNAFGWKPIEQDPDFIYRWDVTEIRAPKNRGIIRFDWIQYFGHQSYVTNNLAKGNSVREAWPLAIWSAHPSFTVNPTTLLAEFNGAPLVLDKASFTWSSKGADEVFSYNVIQGDMHMGDEIVTKYLQSIVLAAESKPVFQYDLKYDFSLQTISEVGAISAKKRQLRQVSGAASSATPESDKLNWFMEYDQYSGGWLSKIITPNRVATNYEFQSLVSTTAPTASIMDPEAAIVASLPWTVPQPAYGQRYWQYHNPYNIEFQDDYKWNITQDRSTCIGEFCFLIAKRAITKTQRVCSAPGTPPGNCTTPTTGVEGEDAISVKILRKNIGGMRVVFEQTFFGKEIIPQNGYLIAYKRNAMNFDLYQWDGASFSSVVSPFQGDPRGSSYTIEEVIPSGGDYFIARLKSNGSENRDIVPVVQSSTGEWITTNRNSAICEFNNYLVNGISLKGNDGKYRPDNGQCMEFTPTGSWDKVISVAASPDYFVVAQGGFGIIQVFRRTFGTGTTLSPRFINESIKMKPGTIGSGLRSYNGSIMTWNEEAWHPMYLYAGKDYFIVKNYGLSTPTSMAMHIWIWDGSNWVPRLATNSTQAWGSGNVVSNVYINSAPGGYTVVAENGLVDRSVFDTRPSNAAKINMQVISANSSNSQYSSHYPEVRSTDNYVSISHLKTDGSGNVMVADGVNESYLLYRSAYNVDGTGARPSLKSSVTPGGLFDVYVSPTEDWLVGKYLNGSTCDFYYVPLPGSPRSMTSGQMPDFSKWIKFASVPKSGSYVPKITFGPGVWMITYGDNSTLKAQFGAMYSTGPVARFPQIESKVVSSVTTKSLYNNHQGTASQKTTFTYGTGMDLVYNGMARQPESRVTTVKQLGKNGSTFSTQTITYLSDRMSAPLDGSAPILNPPSKSQYFAGQVEKVASVSIDGIKTTITPKYQFFKNGLSAETGNWPAGVVRIIPVGNTKVVDDRGAISTASEQFGNFDMVVNQPQVKVSWGANNNGEGTQYRHRVDVTKYNSTGKVLETQSALYKNRSDALLLLNYANNRGTGGDVGPWVNLNMDVFDKKAVWVSRGKVAYATSYPEIDVLSAYKWGWKTRGVDPTKYTSGQVAVPDRFDLVSTISAQRSQIGAPQFTTDNTTGITTSYVYEGPRGLPSAVAVNALPNNVAVLTAEDGQSGLNGTFNSYWKNPTTGSNLATWELGGAFDEANPHTGRYSIKLSKTDTNWAFGPTHNMYFKNVPNWSSGLTATVWMYSTGVRPVFHAEAHVATHAEIGSFDGSPVGGTFIPNTWQQWKMEIPKSALMVPYGSGQKLFSSDAVEDYLRMWVGFKAPTGGTIWVDDFVIAPTESRVAVTSYDHAGRVIGSIDPDGRVARKEYGVQGEVQAVRDERGRIYGQSGVAGKGGN